MDGATEPSEAADAAAPSLEEANEKPTEGEKDEEAIVARSQRLISRIVATQESPNPQLLHALASLVEEQENKYILEPGNSSLSNGRASHLVGRLGNLIRDTDEFYDLVSSKFLTDTRYSIGIRSGAARIILSCSSSSMHHVFGDVVLDNIKSWVMGESLEAPIDSCDRVNEIDAKKPTDSEMLRTYATGLLALSLSGHNPTLEELLTPDLPAMLMHFLRLRIFGEASNQKDSALLADTKLTSVSNLVRVREDNKGRRQVLGSCNVDGTKKIGIERPLGDQSAETDRDRAIWQLYNKECSSDSLKSELADSSAESIDMYKVLDESSDMYTDGWPNKRFPEEKSKFNERHALDGNTVEEVAVENMRDSFTLRSKNRMLSRVRGKGWVSEDISESERNFDLSNSEVQPSGPSRGFKGNCRLNDEENKGMLDSKKCSTIVDLGVLVTGEDDDGRFGECKIGSTDVSNLVKNAARAAEAEARAANAPLEAIIAAGDAAAELVKTSALEAWRITNDEEAAVLAASKAASTVADAAIATDISRNSQVVNDKLVESQAGGPEVEELEFLILDEESLAQLREKYCVQCLQSLGEYVVALGPVLKEKGVDVCLGLLQRSLHDDMPPDRLEFLIEVIKLIYVLVSHRKFATLFVDRGGIQKLLLTRRAPYTIFGLSSFLTNIGCLQGVMERVCALPTAVVDQVVELALQLLECSLDQARKNIAIFFTNAFVFRAILDSFDAKEGLQKMLNILRGAASIRSGGNSGPLGVHNTSFRNDQSPAEVLTPSEKQVAYYTCYALRQYFRAHLFLIVDSLRPNKVNRGIARSTSSARAFYKPLDITNDEAFDAVCLQIQRDRKLGLAFVRARWHVVDKFLNANGHIIMLELCQALPVDRYLHDLQQYAFGVLHIVTFATCSRKLIVTATLSNDRIGMAVILESANGAVYADPEVIRPALRVLENLVCPPPSISTKPSFAAQGQSSVSAYTLNGPMIENRDRHSERGSLERTASSSIQNDVRERNGEVSCSERGGSSAHAPLSIVPCATSTVAQGLPFGVVGDRRISLGTGFGCAGLAAQLEQGYRQAREAVRANNGIKVLLHLLHLRMMTPLVVLDSLRALACRVLLGLARDEAIAHILTKLQVGKKLSELIRDSGSQASGSEQSRWQTELAQVAIELIAIVTNSGRASTLAATDAAAPTLRRIERAAVAAATPVTYHSRELLLLIHEHLQHSGLTAAAASLQKEADLTPLPSLAASRPALHQITAPETSSSQLLWPSGRSPFSFISDTPKKPKPLREDDFCLKTTDSALDPSRKKPIVFSSTISQTKSRTLCYSSSTGKASDLQKGVGGLETSSLAVTKYNADADTQLKTPLLLPMKRKCMDMKDTSSASTSKRLATADLVTQPPVFQTPNSGCKNFLPFNGSAVPYTPWDHNSLMKVSNSVDTLDDIYQNIPGTTTTSGSLPRFSSDVQPGNMERMTLDSLVMQYLKHQHRQCPAPITTLPPLSLLHPHVCPEPSRTINAPANVTARISAREFRKRYGGIHAHRRDRQFIYSRFKPFRTCRDDAAALTCVTFLNDSSHIVTGGLSGDLKIFDTNSSRVIDSHSGHQYHATLVQSVFTGGSELILSSSLNDVRLWDASSLSGGPLHSFEGCKAGRFNHSGTMFAAFSSEASQREVLLYDIQTFALELKFSDTSNSASGPTRGNTQSLIHFSPLDTMLLWNGVLWDRRSSGPVHRFDQFTDYGGGGFHPSGNEVILNSEVWDLRKFKLLRTVPSLEQTVITFSSSGDVIYAILRRNLDDVASAIHHRRSKNPLFAAFRTIDALNYSDIATISVDRCVLDLAVEPTDSFVGVVAMDDQNEMYSSAKIYEVGRRRLADDDSDPDDGAETDEDEDDENDESDGDVDSLLGPDLDSDTDDASNDEDEDGDDSGDEADEDAEEDFNMEDVDFAGAPGFLEIVAEGEDEDDDIEVLESLSSGEEEDFLGNGFGY